MFKNKYNKIYFYTYITIFFLRHIIIANLSQDTAAELFQTNCQKNKYFYFNLFYKFVVNYNFLYCILH